MLRTLFSTLWCATQQVHHIEPELCLSWLLIFSAASIVRTFTTIMLNLFSMCLYGLVSTTATKKATILQPMPPIIMIAFGLLIVSLWQSRSPPMPFLTLLFNGVRVYPTRSQIPNLWWWWWQHNLMQFLGTCGQDIITRQLCSYYQRCGR